ncbi:hypothetical protein [Priestia megaterium]|uniref:hypothetical protein n=1 Tax=Priestia megaterium TaxID=1404 RepID=UPI000D51ED27|nr:hypothetical protein [Priestia megaterium]PVE71134.1 hypothetical protein DC428_11905 [Priestia megaterium]PVE89189.1 hypothetical protein DC421_03750 [Priestia megaterium]PVE92879.1 hypothetical protein DC426_05405 [Priestia megaterium]PVE99051.1 hypothetical protein DC433_14570 [Priestia megaterium]
MKKALIFCSALILLVLGAGMYMNHSKEKQMEQKQNDQMFHKAEQAAIIYFKEKRHKDLMVEKADFADHGFDYIEVTGKVKEGNSQQYLVNVSYNDNYRVTSIVNMD